MKQSSVRFLIGGALLFLCLLYLEPSSAQRPSSTTNSSPNQITPAQDPIEQKQIPRLVESSKRAGANFETRRLFRSVSSPASSDFALQQVISDGVKVNLDASVITNILAEKPGHLTLPMPATDGGTVELELVAVNIFAPGFSVKTSAPTNEVIQESLGLHYRGIVKGNARSLAAISIFKNEIMGFYSSETGGNTVIGRLAGENPTDIHVLYEEKVLKVSPSFECDVIEPPSTLPNSSSQNPEAATNSCVRVYLEADHGLFLNKGTVANTASYLTGVFNQSAALFSNDGVSVSISEITVWNSPSPFTGFDSNAVLEQFQDIRTSFNGDLAHLITLDRGFGGIAFRDVLCNRGFAYGVSDIDATFSNVPTYSWSVGVITHELGHNLGSRHTHACAWNGNNTAIDGCNPPEGTCSRPGIPTNGGTIMSYCHLTSAGINFTFGFGPQPRDVITNRVNASSCLTTCGSTVLPAPTANAATSVTNNSFTANWSSVSNATGYRLDVSTNSSFSSFLSGFNNLDVGNVLSRSVTGLNPGTTYFYRVRAFNSSGTSGNSTTITVVTVPAAPVAKTATGVTGSSFTANWNSASGATGYRLDVSTSSSFSSFVIGYNNLEMGNTLSGSVTGLSPATTYFYRVRAYNSNGISGNSLSITTTTAQGFTITVTASPAAGGTVSGGGTFPAGSSRTVQAVANSGFSFRNWTEGAFIISTFPSFTFPLGFDRNLVANFTETTTADAVYDNVLRVPKCGQVGSVCDSGFLLNGRDSISGGQEPNQPNTLHNSCADNTRGSYHVDQSIDKIVVSTLDGSNFAPGKTVKVEVTVWTLSPSTDFLDLFYAPDATNPNWTYLLSLVPSGVGPRVLTAAFPLAQGRNVQAIRANFLSGGFPDACSGGAPDNFDDHDDLAFTVENGGPPLQLVLEQSGPSSTQAAAMETLFRTRDPFAILKPTLLNPSLDKNTRIAVFAANLQLSPGQPPSVVVVNLVDKNNQSFDVTAEAVAPLLGSPFSQVIFRLPTNLASGVCTIAIKAHGQTSNAGTIRIQ